MAIIKSISVSKEFNDLAKKYHLSWSQASRIGMSIMLGDIGIKEYDNKLNITRKLNENIRKTKEYAQKVFELEEVLNSKEIDNKLKELEK